MQAEAGSWYVDEMRLARAFFTGMLVTLATGCGHEPSEQELLVRRAEEVRELGLYRQVPVRELTQDEYAAEQAKKAAAIDEADLQEFRDTYGRLGFFGPETDLESSTAGSSDWVAGTYNHKTEDITIVGDPSDSVIVHEYVHALQDQHFVLDLIAYAPTTDAYLARKAIVEGDATLAQTRYLLQEKYGADLNDLDWPGFFTAWAEDSETTLAESEYPVIFLAARAFVYPYGAPYCGFKLTGAHPGSPDDTKPFPFDWRAQKSLFFETQPQTTEQVMKLDAADDVVGVGLSDVPESLSGALESKYWDTLGAWYSYLLFYPTDQAAGVGDARELPLLWDGDRVLFVQDKSSGAVGVAWASVWDDDTAAARVENALKTLHGFVPGAMEEPRMGTGADGEALWIERRGPRALLLKNIDPAHCSSLADAALAEGSAPKIVTPRQSASLPARIAEALSHRVSRP